MPPAKSAATTSSSPGLGPMDATNQTPPPGTVSEEQALRLAVLTLASRFNLASTDPGQARHHMEAAVVELLRLLPSAPVLARVVRLLDVDGRQVEPDQAIAAQDPDAVRGYLRGLGKDITDLSRRSDHA